MAKGVRTKAGCSSLKKKDCLENNEECVFCTNIGRCFAKEYALTKECKQGQGGVKRPRAQNANPIAQVPGPAQGHGQVPAPVPIQVQVPVPAQAPRAKTKTTYRVPLLDVFDSLVRYFLRISLREHDPTPQRVSALKPLLRDFIKVRFLAQYEFSQIANYNKLVKEVLNSNPYKTMGIPEVDIPHVISSQLIQGIIAGA